MVSKPQSLVAALLLCVAAMAESPRTRFDRKVIEVAEPERYKSAKQDGLEVPRLESDRFVVDCLAYEDERYVYVETTIKNRSGYDLSLDEDFMTVEAGDTKVLRTNTVKTAEEIEREAIKPFVPEPTGKGGNGRKPEYARGLVEQQARRHVEKQEREVTFAGMLVALAQEKQTTPIDAGAERAIACTFEQRKDRKAPLRITVRAGTQTFAFVFREPEP